MPRGFFPLLNKYCLSGFLTGQPEISLAECHPAEGRTVLLGELFSNEQVLRS